MEFLPRIPGASGWQPWVREGKPVRSVWGTARSGTYILELHLGRGVHLDVGALGRRKFPPGRYVYVGRAMRGLEARLARHLRRVKARPRWHIDSFRARARLVSLSVFRSADPSLECETSARLHAGGGRVEVPGFGSSDCACPSHLFFYPQ
ncbi:MAG: DUF123 domain-containing protein [Nitrospinota bacterium]